MSSAAQTPPLPYSTLHFAAALGAAVVAGGIAFFALGALVSLIVSGPAAVEGSLTGIVGSLIFSILLVGLFGGIPGVLIGLVLLHFHAHSPLAFVAAGVAASLIAPLMVMAFTPLGISGWTMLVIAMPSGAVAAMAAYVYLKRFTNLLADSPT